MKTFRPLALTLAVLLAANTLANTLVYYFYPLEVECMEGTNWIDALAFASGRNPYTDPGLAFINMNHGPLDAPVKAIIARALPWLQPWQVIRLPGLLLPVLLVLAVRSAARSGERIPWTWAVAVGLAGYFVIESTGNMVVHMGRSDALMLALLTPLLPLALKIFDDDGHVRPTPTLLFGATVAAAFLENFRTGIVLPSFALTLAFNWREERFRPARAIATLAVWGLAGAAFAFLTVVGTIFHFDFTTYYRYSLGFFSASGHGLSGSPGRLRELIQPFLENKAVALLPPALVIALITWRSSRAMWVRVAVLGVPFTLFAVAFVSNYLGAAGGLHYFVPLVLLALLLWRVSPWDETRHARALLLVLGAALLGCNWRVVWGNTAHLWHTRHEAAAFDAFVRDLDSRLTVESQDVHLFARRLHATEVDMGFFSYLAKQPTTTAYYPKFAQSFAAHEARMQQTPPDAIVVADFPSEELAARLRRGHYVPVRESPPRIYNAENFTRTHVYVRPDLAAQFPPLPHLTPPFRHW